MFTSILNQTAEVTTTLTAGSALGCTAAALVLGIILSAVYMLQGSHTKNFAISLAVLPALVQVIILMVNGNLGTSVAVLGAFGLVRFRSVPGNSRDILSVVFAMAIGLATGMGYIGYAVAITVIISAIILILSKTPFGNVSESTEKNLRITIPENLDYTGIFDDIFKKYTKSAVLQKVKTTNLGSMYELQYNIHMKSLSQEKEMIDEIRCRNGNLTIICGKTQPSKDEL